MPVPARLREAVIRRARRRCEYCHLAQEGQEATFHVDHIVPIVANGPTTSDNLALACVSCSLRKAARVSAIDPETGEFFRLYHPRQDRWEDHFQWAGTEIVGLTPTGRATIALLRLNRELIVALRKEEAFMGRHPPQMESD